MERGRQMTETMEWQGKVGQSWASEWQRTDRSFTALTAELSRRIEQLEYRSVLDIGCGAGELSMIAARQRPQASVTGLDISPDLVGVASDRGASFANLRFELGDAASWKPQRGFAPDLMISRHGVMFFADPVGGFTNLCGIAAPGARMMFSCFRSPSDNPFFRDITQLLPPSGGPAPDPHAPGPFAFADQHRVAAILSRAGWHNVEFERFDFRMIAGAGDDPVGDALAYFTRIGPAARALAEMDEAQRQEMRAKFRQFLPDHLHDGVVSLPASVWIVTGRAS
jgi:SAM-dependent methyltransferase